MKKLLTIIIIAGMTAFIACGPSTKEKAEKVKQDSIARIDSIKKNFLGKWEEQSKYSNKNVMTISSSGDVMIATLVNDMNGRKDIYTGFVSINGILNVTPSHCGNILYIKEKDQLIFNSNNWRRLSN